MSNEIDEKLKWTDHEEIAILLEENYPDKDNVNLGFTDLQMGGDSRN